MAKTPLTLESLNPDGSIRNPQFWHGALERAAKSAAQGFLAGFGFSTVGDTVVDQASALDGATWLVALTLAGTMAVLSLCTSILNPQFVAGQVAVLEKPVPTGGAVTVGTAALPQSTTTPDIPDGDGSHRAPTARGEVS